MLVLVMALSLAACAEGNPNNSGNASQGPEPTNTGTGNPNTATPEPDENALRYGGHLNFLTEAKPQNLDPAKSTGNYNYMFTTMVYEAPLTRDAEGNIRPNVCEYELSDDQLTLKLWVREGVTFHDGSPVEIEDVIASIQRCVHSSPRKFVTPYIKNVEIDNGTATITFTEYNEKTMYYIACVNPFIGVMPKEICEKYSNESGEIITDVADAIGTGPYKFTELVSEVSISMERYDGYVPVEAGYTGFASPKMAYLDSVTFWYKTDDNAATIALMNGEYDLSEGVSSDYYTQLASAGIVNEKKLTKTGAVIFFNTFGNGIVAGNANMRKAIMAAIDIPELIEIALDGRYEVGVCPALDGAYYTDVFETADWFGEDNVELAKQYLAAAGYHGEELHLVFNPNYNTHFTLICSYLDAAGINYTAEVMESTAAGEFYKDPSNAWDMIFQYPSLNDSPTLLSDNLMQQYYNSPKKDALLAELQGMYAGSNEYIAKWHELADQMVDDCAVAYLAQATFVWSMNSDLHLNYDGLNTYFFNAYWEHPENHTK